MAASKALLPIDKSPKGFQQLALDRQVAFMTMEVVRTREELMGSEALIAKAKTATDAEALHTALFPEFKMDFLLSRSDPFFLRVTEAAWRDACLRFCGHVPPVSSFAAGKQRLPPCERCPCNARFPRTDIIGIIKQQHEPDWRAFLRYITAQRFNGRAITDQSMKQLIAALCKYNEDFLSWIEAQLLWARYPHLDLCMMDTGRDVYSLFVDNLKRPANLLDAHIKELSDGDPFTYGLPLLNALRECGRFVRERVANTLRTLGDFSFEAAASQSDPSRSLALAEQDWLRVTCSGGLHGITCMCNIAELVLKQKRYNDTVVMAQRAIAECAAVSMEAITYEICRSTSTHRFETGAEAHVHIVVRRPFHEEAVDKQLRRAWRCKGDAHIALCYQALTADGRMTKLNLESARQHRKDAAESYAWVNKDLNLIDRESLDKLNQAFRARLQQHIEACKQDA